MPSALETADLLTKHIYHLHDIPLDIISDHGPQFVSRVWRAFCKAIGTTVCLSSSFHPQTNTQIERNNQGLESALRCVASLEANPTSCSSQLPWVEYSHNSLSCSETGRVTIQCITGIPTAPFSLPGGRPGCALCSGICETLQGDLVGHLQCIAAHPGLSQSVQKSGPFLSTRSDGLAFIQEHFLAHLIP